MMGNMALVTGAGRGVGFALVKQLLDKGWTVFAGMHTQEERLMELQHLRGEQLHAVLMDVSSTESVHQAKKQVEEHTDRLDLVINNAAILGDTERTILDGLDLEDVQQVFNVNTLGPLRTAEAFMPLLLNSEQKLMVNISSEAGRIGVNGRNSWFAYTMSKSALNMQSVLIHNQIKQEGGQVLILHPGWVKTYMRGVLDEAADLTPEQSAEGILQQIERHKEWMGDHPAFIDYAGNKMTW
ncbi:SDR family oxidoreductase [Marinicrinis lubricantis]|uniref:SDR family oxidoreductase n=1 Tax=Marinicrinis lubricantis TaxID=2086470 RepID=A0ABW1IUN0_9BACL